MPKNQENKSGSFGALVTGIFLGATAMFLSKKENRAKVKKTAQDLANEAEEKVGDAKKAVEQGTKVAKQKIDNTVEQGKKIAGDTVKKARDKVEEVKGDIEAELEKDK